MRLLINRLIIYDYSFAEIIRLSQTAFLYKSIHSAESSFNVFILLYLMLFVELGWCEAFASASS